MGVQLGDKAGLYSEHGEVRTRVLGGDDAACEYAKVRAS